MHDFHERLVQPQSPIAEVILRLAYFLAFCVFLLPCMGSAGFADDALAPPPAAGLEKLEITTASGTHEFHVEVMRTEAERERGLMFRRYLPQDRGMLFDFGTERPVMMWMKNTFLPLDMIFISRSGKVVGIAENAEPLSEKIIPSGPPAYGVLEVNAGIASQIGLKPGDSVHHRLFEK